jgi:hypothetical protein
MTSRNGDRWLEYLGAEKIEKKHSEGERFTDGDSHVISGMEPSSILGCDRKLSLKVVFLRFKPFRM